MQRRFQQLDVFATTPYSGNPLAVVIDGDDITDDEMQRFANWTNLSETTFLLPPSNPDADYRVRIFTTTRELPFAGHPTLGSCRAWLDHEGAPADPELIVQECGIGLVRIRRTGDELAFGAPPLIRSGPVDDDLRARIERTIGGAVLDVAWADNGPGWVVAMLPSGDDVLAVEPDFGGTMDLKLGLVGRADPADDHDIEVRAFFPGPDTMAEDPVTGSLNASVAIWLMGNDPTIRSYVARQGTALGRAGRVAVERDAADTIWIGGSVRSSVRGTVDI